MAGFELFLSSADELAVTRETIDRIIRDAINPTLRDKARAELVLRTWEREQAQQQEPGKNVNQIFVERALASHGALALFVQALRPGTKEEVEALVSATESNWTNRTHLTVFRFACPEGTSRDPELEAFFAWLSEHGVLWQDTDEVGSEGYWVGLVKALTAYALAAYEAATRQVSTDDY